MNLPDAQASHDRIGSYRTLAELLDEEASLADRFEAVLDEAETALRAGGPLPATLRARLAHGGERTGAALLLDRVQLRFKLGIAG